MSLRTKCALLVLAFELTLAVTLLVTVQYIGTYFDHAAAVLTFSGNRLTNVRRLRTLIRDESAHLRLQVPHPVRRADCSVCRNFEDQIQTASLLVVDALKTTQSTTELRGLQDQLARRQAAIDTFFQDLATAPQPEQVKFDTLIYTALDRLLSQLETPAQSAIDEPYRAQLKASLILSSNALVGFLLGILGLVLVRRWVLIPVQELKNATDEIGRGNREYRANIPTKDEMGQLGQAVNKMSADLARIERQMIQRERLAAMGELISYVAHNIRNPLADIQASAEASRRQLPPDSQLRSHQDAIVGAIDRFQRWLRQLEHTCSPLEVQAEPADIQELIDNVIAVFRPMAERRSVTVICRNEHADGQVPVDARHFEQALAAIVGNAIEAAGDKGRVEIITQPDGDGGQWRLSVADTGPGIPPEVRDKVFSPSFSTKRGGHGLGLALAKKVVELHGGTIHVDCPPSGGTVFIMCMPGSIRS